MLTLNQFSKLDDLCKTSCVWENGVLLGWRQGNNHIIFLYQVDGFYVEIVVDDRNHIIDIIRAFSNTKYLDPYLQDIDISELLD